MEVRRDFVQFLVIIQGMCLLPPTVFKQQYAYSLLVQQSLPPLTATFMVMPLNWSKGVCLVSQLCSPVFQGLTRIHIAILSLLIGLSRSSGDVVPVEVK